MAIRNFPYRRELRPPAPEGLGEHVDREFEKIETAFSNLPYPTTLGVFFKGIPAASEVLIAFPIAENLSFPTDFSGSQGHIGVNPTASFAVTVKKNGTTAGTITISTSGTFAFSTSGTIVTLVPGDVITLHAPATADATAEQIAVTFLGTRA